MNAMTLHLTVSRQILLANPSDPQTWTDLVKYLPILRNSLSCYVCYKILHLPHGPLDASCQHHVCKECVGGKMRLKPQCSWCKDYRSFCEKPQMRVMVQCFKRLCEYIASSRLGQSLANHAASNTNNGGPQNLMAVIQQGIAIPEETDIVNRDLTSLMTVPSKYQPPHSSPKVKTAPDNVVKKKVTKSTHTQYVTTDFEEPEIKTEATNDVNVDTVDEKDTKLETGAEANILPVYVCSETQTESILILPERSSLIQEVPIVTLDSSLSSSMSTQDSTGVSNSTSKGGVSTGGSPGVSPHVSPGVSPGMSSSISSSLASDIIVDSMPSMYTVSMPNQDTPTLKIKRKNPSGTTTQKRKMPKLTPEISQTPPPLLKMEKGKGKKKQTKNSTPKKQPAKPKEKSERKGCRCGTATPTPGQLTCCGQRCPCYTSYKACLDCRCRGCRNPRMGGIIPPPSDMPETTLNVGFPLLLAPPPTVLIPEQIHIKSENRIDSGDDSDINIDVLV